jgi:uncharacterized membrane protein
VNTINRQRFLAELSKLLTFMYEEDRQRALSMYERMFDITEDEQGLIQHLMSPTRQAVIIARAYDAKERKLSVSTQVRGDTDETEGSEIPKFVLAINKIFDDLFPDSAEDALEKDQVSFFDLGLAQKEDFTAPKPAVPAGAVLLSDTQKFRLDPQAAEAGDANEAETTAADEAPDADFVPADETVSVEPDSTDETQDFLAGGATIDELITAWKKDLEADMGGTAETAADPDAAADVPAAAEELPAQETEEEISSEELPASSAEEAPAPEEAPVEEAAEEAPEDAEVPETDGAESEAAAETDIPVEDSDGADAVEEAAPVPEAPLPAGSRKSAAAPQEASVPKTVLFLLVAIPVALLLLALLLIPTMLFVGVSAGLIILGATLAVSAFSGFSVLADLLLLIGAALVALALGLLFLWLTVWTIGGGMGGVIRTIGNLHRKLCMKKGVSEE